MSKRYPITMMCAACVPWTDKWEFDKESFRNEIKYLLNHGVRSIYIFGTAGEGYAVNREVFSKVVHVLLDECRKVPGAMPMTGVISTSIMEIIDRIKIGRDLGCRDFQIALPCWGALNDDEVFHFFKIICGQFPDCQFMHYNNGIRSKKLCEVDLYVKIAKELPNLVAVKYSTSNIREIYDIIEADCPVTFYLVDNGYTYGSMKGECGLLNSFASVDMHLAWKYFHAGREKDYETLLNLDSYYRELEKSFNIIDREVIDSALDKTIARVADHNFSNAVYPPYQGITEDEFKIIASRMGAVKSKYIAQYKNKDDKKTCSAT